MAMGIGGSIPGSDVLFLTLERSSLGVRALTCLSSGCKGHPLSSSHAVHAAFSVGVYINVLALIYIPKKFQGTIKYMYPDTYMKLYMEMKLSLSGILPQLLNFF